MTRQINGSRRKAGLPLLGSASFVLICVLVSGRHPNDGALRGGEWFFGLCAVVQGVLFARPHRLLLDDTGLTLTGRLMRKPFRLAWRDVDEFRLVQLPRGGTMVRLSVAT